MSDKPTASAVPAWFPTKASMLLPPIISMSTETGVSETIRFCVDFSIATVPENVAKPPTEKLVVQVKVVVLSSK